MESGKKGYTFFWKIENYSFCSHKNGEKLISPDFRANELECKNWNLLLYPRGWREEDRDCVSLFLSRSALDEGPDGIWTAFEVSILASDGSHLEIMKSELPLPKGGAGGWYKFLKLNEILFQKKADYLPQDILTVRCKIWEGEGKDHNTGQSFARTRIKVEKISFLHVLENFSALDTKQKRTVKILSHSKGEHFISSTLHFTDCSCCKEKIVIEIAPSDADQILRKCELFLLDVSGNVKECGKADNRYDIECKRIDKLPLSFTRTTILGRKSEYLPDDKLSLVCKCFFSNGLEFQTIEETVHEIPSAVMKQTDDALIKNACKAAATYPNGLDDIKVLYTDKSLTDLQLRTKTKSFPTHKVVLCARSPVFKRMMTSDMKEKNTDCIEVDDLEDDVVDQLLLFLYSDTVQDLQWAMATQLYYAADKYEIGRLKAICSSFLLEHLTPITAGELLLLADTHSDQDLKKSVEDFILEHEEEVFVSDEWEKLVESNPVLVMKTMQLKYKRKKNEVN